MQIPIGLELNGVKAVNTANIELSGLTVLCGANSTGKSTITRVLQDTIEMVLYFKGVRRYGLLVDFINDVISSLVDSVGPDAATRKLFLQFLSLARRDTIEEDYRIENILNLVRKMEQTVRVLWGTDIWKTINVRSRYCTNLLSMLGLDEGVEIQEVEAKILEKFRALRESLLHVDVEVPNLENISSRMVSEYLWDGCVKLREKGDVVWAYKFNQTDQFSSIASVKRVFHIASPFATDIDVHGSVVKVTSNYMGQHIGKQISHLENDSIVILLNDVLNGYVEYKLDKKTGNRGWHYERRDGKSFLLSMSASGIRSISTLARLYHYNLLDENTVVILDEPEAHLHPAWIIAYAQILVELIKRKNVRILLASHSPDMVHALKAFALASGVSEETRFYQAVESKEDPFKYDFELKGLDIGSIFDSFNEVDMLIANVADKMRGEN